MELKEALGQLDTMDDSLWTKEGLPAVDKVAELMGRDVTRKEITDAAPHFTRASGFQEEEQSDAEEEGVREGRSQEVEEYLSDLPMVPAEFNALLQKVGPSELPTFDAILSDQLAGLLKDIEELEELKRRVKVNLATVRARIQHETPDKSNQQAIMDYIAAQNKNRAEKAQRARKVAATVDLKDLDPRAPIDRAFARKKGRGTQRPVR